MYATQSNLSPDGKELASEEDIQQACEMYSDAQLFMREGRYEAAIPILEEASRLSPNYRSLQALGECLIALQRYRDAIIPLAASTILGQRCHAPTLLAELFLRFDNLTDAERVITTALARDANYKRAVAIKRQIDELREEEMQLDDEEPEFDDRGASDLSGD